MLVLTRKLEQSIQIGDDITITILAVKGNTVRIGISAPEHVRVARSELNQRGSERAPKTQGETSNVAEMEVIEIQSRPDARITFDRVSSTADGPISHRLTPPKSNPPKSVPPLHSRLPMFSDGNYETHHLRIPVVAVDGQAADRPL